MPTVEWLTQHVHPSIDWSYALITLVVRFIGVFVVMLAMQGALQAAARAVRMIENRKKEAGEQEAAVAKIPGSSAQKLSSPAVDAATVAAIGLALALEQKPKRQAAVTETSAWGIAGRVAQLERLSRTWR